MKNVEKLAEIGILPDIRQRLGAKDENDSSCDGEINQMTSSELIAAWAGWHLGSNSWWTTMKQMFDQLEEMK